MARFGVDAKIIQLYEQAAIWWLRKEGGELCPRVRRHYDRWISLPDHAEAMRRMEAFCRRLDQVKASIPE